MPRHIKGIPEKSKDFKGTIKKLFSSLNNWRYLVVIALVFSFISAILGLISPNKLSKLTDTITLGLQPNINEKVISDIMQDETIRTSDKQQLSSLMQSDKEDTNSLLKKFDELPESIYNIVKPRIDMERVKSLSIFIGILIIGSALLNYLQALIMTIISNNFAKKLRKDVSKKINKLPLRYFDSHETGDVLSRVTNDIDTIGLPLIVVHIGVVTGVVEVGSVNLIFHPSSNVSTKPSVIPPRATITIMPIAIPTIARIALFFLLNGFLRINFKNDIILNRNVIYK